ncbi:hypothetical protein JCM3770_005757 [Rhodotorula araucariae]
MANSHDSLPGLVPGAILSQRMATKVIPVGHARAAHDVYGQQRDHPLPFALPFPITGTSTASTASSSSSSASAPAPVPALTNGGTPLTPFTPAGLGLPSAAGRVGRTPSSDTALVEDDTEGDDLARGEIRVLAPARNSAGPAAGSPSSEASSATPASSRSITASAASALSEYRAPQSASAVAEAGAAPSQWTRASTGAAGAAEGNVSEDEGETEINGRAAKRRALAAPRSSSATAPAPVAGPSSGFALCDGARRSRDSDRDADPSTLAGANVLRMLAGLASSPGPETSASASVGKGQGKGKERAQYSRQESEARESARAGGLECTERDAQKRREDAEDLELAKQGKYGWILQDVSCSSRRTSHPLSAVLAVNKCQACTSRYVGHVCAFSGIRSFPLSSSRSALPYPSIRDAPGKVHDDTPLFPTQFDAPFTRDAARLLKSAAATHLAPTLRGELVHARRPGCARIRRQLATTHTCDGCNAAVLCGSWLCRTCGREYCLECGAALALAPPLAAAGEENPNARDKLTRCRGKGARHTSTDLVPLSRIPAEALARTLAAMDAWRVAHPLLAPRALPDEWLAAHRVPSGEREEGLAVVRLSGALVPPRLDEAPRVKREGEGDDGAHAGPPERVHLPSVADAVALSAPDAAVLAATRVLTSPSAALASHASLAAPWTPPLPHGAETLFRALWALGEPLVVDLAPPDVPALAWTPAFLARAYGHQRCRVGSNRVEGRERETTVGEFFEAFGRRGGQRWDSEKIKDWPAAKDFKDEYPDLWHDFMSVLPAGSITRRDGVLNISAHTPRNANPPDLGPKGYFSEISEDGPGGNGSTKLHTVNVMLWASDAPDGGPGVAIWDLYRAEDADKIRDFLYGHIARLEGWADAAAVRARVDDPIHTQRFYLDAALRAALLASHGVRSFRVHQRPGQAIFIPAGCAHQVCNMADCVKVATDFVSVENVARCWKVTDEFRAQTKDKVLWRSDVLQLKSMLLWAWYSAERIDPAPELNGEDGVEVGTAAQLLEGEQPPSPSYIDGADEDKRMDVDGREGGEGQA